VKSYTCVDAVLFINVVDDHKIKTVMTEMCAVDVSQYDLLY
jgi:hypothetical protein